jgi:ParB-like chromosome segregation protein Spo0J
MRSATVARLINLSDIIVPENRQRKEFDEKGIDELATSICERGLMHPPVVRNDGRTLVAGERRLRAIHRCLERGDTYSYSGAAVPPDKIPVTLLGDLTPLEVREAELEENVIRRDLTWQEHNAAIAELHRLRSDQAVERGETQTYRDTASEIVGKLATGSSISKVSNALLLSEHLDDEEVSRAKTEKEALKIIERKKRQEHRAKLAEEFGSVASTHQYIIGDSFDAAPKLADAAFDLLITDPPYGVSADGFGSQAGASHEYKDDIDFAMKCYALAFETCREKLKGNAAAFLFCDIRLFSILRDVARNVAPNFSWWETPLIWQKDSGMLPVPDRGPRRTYEAIIYGYRGNRLWTTPGSNDIFAHPSIARPEFGAQKPKGLYTDLLSRVAQPGDRVLDIFAGTCPAVGAAKDLSLTATCIELDKRKVDYAKLEYGIS